MNKRARLKASILTGFVFCLLGCESGEPEPKETKHESAQPGPAAEPGVIQPATNVSLPPTGPTMPEAKKDEPKMEPPK